MALFSSNTKNEQPKKAAKAKPAKKVTTAKDDGRLARVLTAPWFSEKALIGTEHGIYVFRVPTDVTKTNVAAAVEKYFKVTPVKVRMVNLPAKKVSLRTRRGIGTRERRRKAYVYLKKGDSIELT